MSAFDSWSRHQNNCLQEFKHAKNLEEDDIRVAFPGSMLFNQLLLVDESRSFEAVSVNLRTLDVVFRYCGRMDSGVEGRNLLVVGDNKDALPGVDHCISQMQGIDAITVLGSAPEKIAQHLSDKNSQISVNALHPDWGNIDALYKLFREAKHSVFVDTMRVMDAAFTGNACTLITSDAFRQDIGFEYLLWNLQKVKCDVLDSNGASLNQVSVERFPFLVVENNTLEVERQIAKKSDQDQPYTDCFAISHSDSADELIALPMQSAHGPIVRLKNRKSKFARKATKLCKDPRAFLEDSNNALLKGLAELLSRRSTR